MSTRGVTSRLPWRATTISGSWPDTSSVTRFAPILCSERRSGGGDVCGDAVMVRSSSVPYWGGWPIDLPLDWLERVNRADEEQELESLRRSVQRVRSDSRDVSRRLPNDWASSRPIVPRVVRESWAGIEIRVAVLDKIRCAANPRSDLPIIRFAQLPPASPGRIRLASGRRFCRPSISLFFQFSLSGPVPLPVRPASCQHGIQHFRQPPLRTIPSGPGGDCLHAFDTPGPPKPLYPLHSSLSPYY